MKKLESIQEKYGNRVEILTVSSDSKKNLQRYIDNTHTKVRIAFDTIHYNTFNYKYIPHIILIDTNGYIRAITTPDKITDEIISDFISGKDISIVNIVESATIAVPTLNKQFKSNDYQYKLTSENSSLSFKNEIKRDENNEPISLEFNNVSIYRLLSDIYQLSSVARIYSKTEISTKNKYCFKLEQSDHFYKPLLQHAKEILNDNIGIKAQMVEKTLDSLYIVEIVDPSKLPKASDKVKYFEMRGPYYKATKISSHNLIEYLENELMQPVKDKTNLDYDFDIELNWAYEKRGSLNAELGKYGLKVKKSPTPEKLMVLELDIQERQ